MQDLQSLDPKDRELIELACKHLSERRKSGNVSIAGIIRTIDGSIYTGTNLKYSVSNVCTCGEIMALHNALNAGETRFDTIVGVKYFVDDDEYQVVNSCGLCRQLFIHNVPLKVLINQDGIIQSMPAEDLLPYAYL